jgi:hypothetical protein
LKPAPGKIVHETLSQKRKNYEKKGEAVVQGVGPEFKPQYLKKKRMDKQQIMVSI